MFVNEYIRLGRVRHHLQDVPQMAWDGAQLDKNGGRRSLLSVALNENNVAGAPPAARPPDHSGGQLQVQLASSWFVPSLYLHQQIMRS